jgi:hypothetical protein
MLNNKKIGIRLIAFVLTLLMAAAMFAGCTDKEAQDAAAIAESKAAAANEAAAAAQAAALSAAAAASDLAAQLDAAKAAAAAAESKAAAASAAAANAQSNLNSVVSGIANQPAQTGDIAQKDYNGATQYVTTTILAELSQLKVKYLTVRYYWYTESNYLKLAKLFDDAYIDIYRATTADGVKGVITKLTTDIAAIPSIATEAEAIQAQIKAFGDVDTSIFTTHEANVTKARSDYSVWLATYRNYFSSNGINVDNYAANKDAIDAYVLKNFGIATTTLRYAESKIATLKTYAGNVSLSAYTAISTIWGATDYNTIKTKSAAIDAAYALYRIFVTANGGDGSPITYKDTSVSPNRVLTGEQFVKQYVLVLYDNWFEQYKTAAVEFVNTLPAFFLNSGVAGGNFAGLDTTYLVVYSNAVTNADYTININGGVEVGSTDQQLLNEFNKIAVLNNAEYLKWTYSGSFKGTLSLDDAYLQVDNYVTKAIVEMAALYYNRIALPKIESDYAALKATVNNATYLNSTNSTYKTYDIAFGNEYVAAVDAYIAAAKKVATKTYDELKAATNIEDLRIFSVSTATNDVVTTYNGAALEAVLKSLNRTIKEAGYSFATAKTTLGELKEFYDFRRSLCDQMDAYITLMDATSDVLVTKINNVITATGGTALTSVSTLKTDNTTVATNFRTAVMALSYNNYSAQTYQAKTSDNKALYYDKAATGTAKTSTSNVARNPLTIKVDKLVVAKDAATTLFGQYADQMFKGLTDLCRTQLNTYIDKSVQLYKTNYASDANVDTLNLKADIENYIAYIKTLSAVNSIGTFDPAAFSLENDAIATGITIDAVAAQGYVIETVKANSEYVLHVKDFTNTAAQVYTGVADLSYTNRADKVLDSYCALTDVYSRLEKVRLLAYYKDQKVVELSNKALGYIGTWDATTGTWKVAPTLSYDYYSSRKVRYLSEVQAVYERLVAAVNAITMLDKDVVEKPVADQYTFAVAKVDAVFNLYDDVTDNKKASESKDDYSFQVAYDRYYATNASGAPIYDWSKYNQ